MIEDKNKLIQFWISSSDKDWVTMNNLFKSGDYSWSLFVGHLVIDIAIVLDQGQFTFNNEMDLVRLRRAIDLRIELHPFLKSDFNESNPLAHEILKYGIQLI